MKVLIVTGRSGYPFELGGDSVDLFTYQLHLSKFNIETLHVGIFDSPKYMLSVKNLSSRIMQLGWIGSWNWQTLSVKTVKDKRQEVPFRRSFRLIYPINRELVELCHFLEHVRERVHSWRPDVIIAAQELASEVILGIRDFNIPIVCILSHAEFSNDKLIRIGKDLVHFIAQSKWLAEYYADIKPALVWPPIEIETYRVVRHMGGFVTMFNPSPEKGGDIFLRIAIRMPEVLFLCVEGWYDLTAFFKKKRLPNVTWCRSLIDVRWVYERTDILLVPSRWQETFGRVVAEAQCNGIPVVASERGGLAETVGPGGILIKDFENISQWVSAIKLLWNNQAKRSALGAAGRRHVRKFQAERSVKRMVKVLTEVVKKGKICH